MTVNHDVVSSSLTGAARRTAEHRCVLLFFYFLGGHDVRERFRGAQAAPLVRSVLTRLLPAARGGEGRLTKETACCKAAVFTSKTTISLSLTMILLCLSGKA